MICSPSPGVTSTKFWPYWSCTLVVCHVSGLFGSENQIRDGFVAAPPGPAVVWVPNAVATIRLFALFVDVLPGAAAVTAIAPGRGMVLAAPFTIAAGAAHDDPVPAAEGVRAVRAVQVLVARGRGPGERPRPAGVTGEGRDQGAGLVEGFQPGAAPGDELVQPGGGVEGAEAVDAVDEVVGGEVGVAVALADGAAFREGDVEEVDGVLVADRVRLVAEQQAAGQVVEADGLVTVRVRLGAHSSSPMDRRLM